MFNRQVPIMKCQYYNVSPWMVDIHYADIFEFTGMLRMVIDTSGQVSISGDKEAKQTEIAKNKFSFLTFSFTDPHALTTVSFTLTKTETGVSVDHGSAVGGHFVRWDGGKDSLDKLALQISEIIDLHNGHHISNEDLIEQGKKLLKLFNKSVLGLTSSASILEFSQKIPDLLNFEIANFTNAKLLNSKTSLSAKKI